MFSNYDKRITILVPSILKPHILEEEENIDHTKILTRLASPVSRRADICIHLQYYFELQHCKSSTKLQKLKHQWRDSSQRK